MPARAIIPKSMFNAKSMATVVTNTMNAAAHGARVDFRVTTRTWKTEVDFKIDNVTPYVRRIYTTNRIYIFVNFGTKPHVIRPKNKKILAWKGGGRAKSRVRKIKSNKGRAGRGSTIFARVVHHPGTEPRAFDEEIVAKWQKQLPELMQRAIDSAIK